MVNRLLDQYCVECLKAQCWARCCLHSIRQTSVVLSDGIDSLTTPMRTTPYSTGPAFHQSGCRSNPLWFIIIQCIATFGERIPINWLIFNATKSEFKWCVSPRWTPLINRSGFMLTAHWPSVTLGRTSMKACQCQNISTNSYVRVLINCTLSGISDTL